jgi:PAS domain S-box-containing protein
MSNCAVGGAGKEKDSSVLLRESENMVMALLESASQAILSIDQNGRIVLANARTEEMFGYSREELLGARIEILLPEFRRRAQGSEREEYIAQPRVRPMGIGMDLAGRRKGGTEFPIEISLTYVETTEGTFAVAFVNEISGRKRLEEQLLQTQTMEAVGRLVGRVAHDFNNLLTVIAGYSGMMLDEFSPLDPLRGYAEEVLKAVHQAGALTKQLLAFSHSQVIQPCVVNMNATVLHTSKMLRRPQTDRRGH